VEGIEGRRHARRLITPRATPEDRGIARWRRAGLPAFRCPLSVFRQATDYDPAMNDPPRAGMALAVGSGVSSSPYQAVRAAYVRASTNEWLRLRPLRTLPGILVVAPLLFLSGFPRARVAAVLAVQVLIFLHQLAIAWQARRASLELRTFFLSHLLLATGHAVNTALTGGLASPLWPSLVGATLGTFYVFGRERESAIAGGYTTVLVLAIALLPADLCGPPIARPYHVALAAWSILFTLFILRLTSVSMSDSYQQIGDALTRSREDVIDAATCRARSLESIGSKVAHELKNPLSAIKGLVQLLARSAADERSRERLEVVAGEVSRMEHILRDYLTFARPLEELNPAPVDLGAIADDVLAVLEARAEAAGVTLARTGGPVVARGDARRLKEALLNLVANALEATPREGSVEVGVSRDDAQAVMTVRDTGKGISVEDLARIGTPFFTKREGGTGLGVVLARAAIRQHGGDLCYESEPGHGTLATVRLPLRSEEVAHAS
jgi:signal transduction histidine kinase